jgi:hypothetical protein
MIVIEGRYAVKGVGAMGTNLAGIKEGDAVALVAEPSNPHDSHAIRVEAPEPGRNEGRLLGYVPRDVAKHMNAADYTASVALVLPHPETGQPAGLRIDIKQRVST